MIVTSAVFVKSAVRANQYPPPELLEIAFVGRSNVGKSSLINALLNRKRLAKTSSTPGRTQLINFFRINERFMFVDLPGFGYAKVPAKIHKKWPAMVRAYLSSRPNLKGIVLIMDIRRQAQSEERDLIQWFRQLRLLHKIMLTKADKLSKSRQSAQRIRHGAELGLDAQELVLFSAKTKQGREAAWTAVASMLELDVSASGKNHDTRC